MSKTYNAADEKVLAVVTDAAKKWHPDVVNAQLRIGVVMVDPDRDDAGNAKAPAITHGGNAAAAKIRKTGVRERVHCPYDAIVMIDLERWEEFSPKQRLALMDHELEHIEIRRSDNGDIKLASDGRPVLRLKPDDFALTGFLSVAKRHGTDALEVSSLRTLHDECRQLLFPFLAESAPAGPKAKAVAS